MRVLLTGINGFIGANMARRLLKEGHEVHAFVRNGPGWRIKDIESQLNIYQADITRHVHTDYLIKRIKPEAFLHLATFGAYPDSQKDVQKIFDVNVMGLVNLLNSYSGHEVFINTSSSSVYGNREVAMNERMELLPKDHYGASKAAAEIECRTRTRIDGARIINTRLFSAYGPYEEPTRLIASTINHCLKNEPMSFTAGTQMRDFIHIQDIEDAYMMLLKRPDLAGETLNIGTGQQWSVKEAVETILLQVPTYKGKCHFGKIPTRSDETFNWVADTSKTSELLGWKAAIEFKKGIRKTVEWQKGML